MSELNHHTQKLFSENVLAVEIKKIKVKMFETVHLGLLILKIRKSTKSFGIII